MTSTNVRILFIIGSLNVGGAEQHLSRILPQLGRCGFQPSVYTLSVPGELAKVLQGNGIDVLSPPSWRFLEKAPGAFRVPARGLLAVIGLLKVFLTWKPQIVHFFLPHAYILGGMVSLLFPSVKRVMSRRSMNYYQRDKPFHTKLEKFLHRHIDAALGNSKAVVRDLQTEGVDVEKIGLIYNGIDMDAYGASCERRRIRRSLGINEDDFVMIKVANLISYKGHEMLLDSLASCVSKLPSGWRLICVGRDDGIGVQLEEKAERLGISQNIMWFGQRLDVPLLLSVSDLALLVSYEEGFSNSILEAMASNLPMIVTNVGGNSEVVDNGVNGIVVEAGDSSALTQALVNISCDEKLRMSFGSRARTKVEREFSLKVCVKRYVDAYNSLLRNEGISNPYFSSNRDA